jgi:predicted nucleic acid-binding protein
MNIVIDTSAIIAVITNEPERPKLIEATIGFDLIAPQSVHWEVGNAFSAMFKRKRLSIEQAEQAIESYQKIPIKFVTVDLKQALNISASHSIYAYDAYLIVCALNNKAPLISLDKYLINQSLEVGIKIIEI